MPFLRSPKIIEGRQPKEVRNIKRDLYFKELALVLKQADFIPLPQENDSLPVEYQG